MPNKRTKIQRLGQHFLADPLVLGRIVEASAISKDEVVLEAGTGHGILTKELCKYAKQVLSYEVDKNLYESALVSFSSSSSLTPLPNLKLVHADLFKQEDFDFDVFVSNLPYSKSREAFQWLACRGKFKRAVVMLQKEFAAKLTAVPPDPQYRSISALASYCFEMEHLFEVPKESFSPPPSVESTVIRATPKNHVSVDIIKRVNWLFSQRNKRAAKVAAKLGVSVLDLGDVRIDQLMPNQIISLAMAIR